MKKLLLSALCATATISSAFAIAPTFTELNSVSFNNIITANSDKVQNKVTLSPRGDVYLTGVFDTEFTAATPLTPIATSSYLINFDKNLVPKSNVAIQGAATITGLAAMSDGVCVVGTFADEVVFESTDGNNKTAEGMKIEGAFTTSQNASFVAAYSTDGILKLLLTFIPQTHSKLVDSAMYFPEEGSVYFRINNVAVSDSKLVLSAIYTGRTEVLGSVFEAGYMNLFDYMYSDLRAGAIFTINGDQTITTIASVTPGNNVTVESNVKSVSTTLHGSKIYPAFIANGDQTLNILGETEQLSFFMDGAGTVEFGNIIASVDTNNGDVTKKIYGSKTDKLYDINRINQMTISNGSLILAGTFIDNLAFDNNIKSFGSDDMYVVALDPTTLDVKWNFTSGYDETDATKFAEQFNSLAIADNVIRLNGMSNVLKPFSPINNLAYNIDANSGALLDSQVTEGVYTTGAAGAANTYFQATVDGPAITGVTLKRYEVVSGVNDAIINNDVTAYPNPTTDVLNFNTACDVNVFTIDGKVVANENNVTSINVSNLSNGIYFVTITKDNASKTVKVIKN